MKQFEIEQVKAPKKSAFDLSHRRVTTFNPAEIVPVFCKEILPGDRFKMNLEAYLKTMPLVSPVMHHVNLYAHAFFVPCRLIYGSHNGFHNDTIETWEKFISGENDYDLPSWDPSAFYALVKIMR